MLPKEDREIISKIGRYHYNKMKKMNMTFEEYQNYQKKIRDERKFKEKIGYKKYKELQELGMTLEEYMEFKEKTKYKNRQKYEEKNKIRFKTIRYIERYCDLEIKCQICSTKENVEAHHPNYNEYLKINLLCKKHHNKLHCFELIPPEIIDLEKIAIKRPPKAEKRRKINEQLDDIKKDILESDYTYKELSRKYEFSGTTIRRFLEKQEQWEILKDKLRNNRKKKIILVNSKTKNPFFEYKKKYNVTSKEISRITGIPISTLRAIETGKTNLTRVSTKTKEKLEILNQNTAN